MPSRALIVRFPILLMAFTSMPIERAEPAISFAAASMSFAFRSFILAFGDLAHLGHRHRARDIAARAPWSRDSSFAAFFRK